MKQAPHLFDYFKFASVSKCDIVCEWYRTYLLFVGVREACVTMEASLIKKRASIATYHISLSLLNELLKEWFEFPTGWYDYNSWGWLSYSWNVYKVTWLQLNSLFTIAELPIGWFNRSWASAKVNLLIEYLRRWMWYQGECSIRVSWSRIPTYT